MGLGAIQTLRPRLTHAQRKSPPVIRTAGEGRRDAPGEVRRQYSKKPAHGGLYIFGAYGLGIKAAIKNNDYGEGGEDDA